MEQKIDLEGIYTCNNESGIGKTQKEIAISAMQEAVTKAVEATLENFPNDEEIKKWVHEHGYYGHCTQEWHEGLDEGANWMKSKILSLKETITKTLIG